MANEFVAKNGLISQNNSTVSGSLIVTQGITGSFSGSVVGYVPNTATSSFVTNSQTSSFVQNSQTSSFVTNSQTSSFVLNTQTSSMTAGTASKVTVTDTTTGTGPYYVAFTAGTTGAQATLVDSTGLLFNATTNTLTVTSSFATTASYALTSAGGGGGISQGKVVAIATGYSNLF